MRAKRVFTQNNPEGTKGQSLLMETGFVCDARHLMTRGFGFITPDAGGANIFFHSSGAGNEEARHLARGSKVTFVQSSNSKGPCAIRVTAGPREGQKWKADDDDVFDRECPAKWLEVLEPARGLACGFLTNITDESKSQASRRRTDEFRAAQTLFRAAGQAADRDASKHMAAAERFHASQLERQRAGLETNTRKQHQKDVAQLVVSAHDKALMDLLACDGRLTVDRLRKVHALLCEGQNAKEPGRLRSVTVKVGRSCPAGLSLKSRIHCKDRGR